MTRLQFVSNVVSEQGEIFADELLHRVLNSTHSAEAFAKAAIIKWPGGESDALPRYFEITERIEEITFAFARRAIAEAFVIAANVVLERERDR